MSVDMTKWCEIAKANMGKRPAGEGRLGGKICIVTGAAQGFGKGIAEELYKEGASIVIADMNEPLAKQVAAEMGERAVAIAVNVSDEESVAHMVAQTVEKFGGLDLMLSNAGVVRWRRWKRRILTSSPASTTPASSSARNMPPSSWRPSMRRTPRPCSTS